MLKKMVDGKEIILSETEERQQRAYWALNDSYPEYVGHCGWDGVSEPVHDMVECRKHHTSLMNKAVQNSIVDINKKIEIAEEQGNAALRESLLIQRKVIRSHMNKDFNSCKTVQELRSSVPDELKPCWNK